MPKLTCIFYLIVCHTARLRAKQIEGKIVGGELANIINHPHSVFLSIKCKQEPTWTCGGSIINQKIILTAGHCMENCDSSTQILARVGSSDKDHGSLYKIDAFALHENYNQRTSLNDIGLLRTEKAIKFSNKVSRVALMEEPPYTEDATVAGWGVIDEKNDIASPKLKFLAKKVWSYSDCVRILDRIPKGTICAAAHSESGYAASGDSGSALVVRGYIQIGIVSCSKPAKDKHLMIYVDVGYYYKWISSKSMALHCSSRRRK